MPYKSDSIRLTGLQDRRRKLTDAEIAEIRKRYEAGQGSYRSLADRYHVSKDTIARLVNPARQEWLRQYRKDNWQKYVDREKLTASVRKLRRYKHELYMKGELTE